jgi:DNA-binding NarL/FixJ family response regulator
MPLPAKRRSVLIVDAHPIARAGLKSLIGRESDLVLCAEAGSVADAVRLIDEHRPDVVVIDPVLGEGAGFELIRRLLDRQRSLSILVCSVCDDVVFAMRALGTGARGFIGKTQERERIIEALRRVLAGERYYASPLLLRRVTGAVDARPDDPSRGD